LPQLRAANLPVKSGCVDCWIIEMKW